MSVSLGGVTSLLVYRQLLRRAASSKPEVDVVTVTADLNTRSSDGSRLNSLKRYHRKFTKCSGPVHVPKIALFAGFYIARYRTAVAHPLHAGIRPRTHRVAED
jgi:hypothetical protein